MVKKTSGEILIKITIRSRFKKQIISELDNVNINIQSVFPGLESIGRYVENSSRLDLIKFLRSV